MAKGSVSQISIFSPKVSASGYIKHTTASETASIALVSHGIGVFPLSKLQTALLPDHVIYREFKEDFQRNMGIGIRSLKSVPPTQRAFVQATQMAAEIMLPGLSK